MFFFIFGFLFCSIAATVYTMRFVIHDILGLFFFGGNHLSVTSLRVVAMFSKYAPAFVRLPGISLTE